MNYNPEWKAEKFTSAIGALRQLTTVYSLVQIYTEFPLLYQSSLNPFSGHSCTANTISHRKLAN